jgi:hypothetical protein
MWSETACRNPVMICLSTIEKFKQRVPLGYRPRVPSFPYHIQYYKSSNIYHDFSIPRRNEFEHLKKYIKDGNHLRLLNRMNNHDRFAAVLGILPNQLIRLVRETKPEDKDAILKDLRLSFCTVIECGDNVCISIMSIGEIRHLRVLKANLMY